MNRLFTILAFIGPILQFAAAIISSRMTNFQNLETKYNLPQELYLEPAGLAFAVWGVIFISFILLGIYQASPKRLDQPTYVKARPFIFLSGLGNVIWFYGDTTTILTISTAGFIIMLLSLTRLNNLFRLGEKSDSLNEFWFVKFPISLFYGWITVAFPIGITIWIMSGLQISGNEFLNPEIWSTLIILVAFGIFSSLKWFNKVSSIFLFAGIWGLYWIYIANRNEQVLIAHTALFSAILLIVEVVVIKLGIRRRLFSPN